MAQAHCRTACPDALAASLNALARVLEASADPVARCQAHVAVAQAWHTGVAASRGKADAVEAATQSEWHWRQALRCAQSQNEVALSVQARVGLAVAALQVADTQHEAGEIGAARVAANRARDTSFAAVQGLRMLDDKALEASLLERIARVLEACGDVEDAHAIRDRARRMNEAPPSGLDAVTRASLLGALA